MAYSIEKLLAEVQQPALQLAESLNVSLRLPDFSNYNYHINSDKKVDGEFISKCFAFTIQFSESSSIIMVGCFYFNGRFCIEFTFRTSLINDVLMASVLNKLNEIAPEHIGLNVTLRKNAPSSMIIGFKIDN